MMRDRDDRPDARRLLEALRRRHDIGSTVAIRIDEILGVVSPPHRTQWAIAYALVAAALVVVTGFHDPNTRGDIPVLKKALIAALFAGTAGAVAGSASLVTAAGAAAGWLLFMMAFPKGAIGAVVFGLPAGAIIGSVASASWGRLTRR